MEFHQLYSREARVGSSSSRLVCNEFSFRVRPISCSARFDHLDIDRKSGSSAYWMAIQIRGAPVPVQAVSIRPSSGSKYTALKREDYNHFSASSGVGPGPFTVLVRLQGGKKVFVHNVKLNEALSGQ